MVTGRSSLQVFFITSCPLVGTSGSGWTPPPGRDCWVVRRHERADWAARTPNVLDHQGEAAQSAQAPGEDQEQTLAARQRVRGDITPHPAVERWCLPEPVKSAYGVPSGSATPPLDRTHPPPGGLGGVPCVDGEEAAEDVYPLRPAASSLLNSVGWQGPLARLDLRILRRERRCVASPTA